MQLTRHTDYALRVLMYLGSQQDSLASVSDISDYYSISRNHLVKVVQGLVEHGFVKTERGKYGGMKLAKAADKISIGDVIRKMESHFDIVECMADENHNCRIDNACSLKGTLQTALEKFLQELDKVSLEQILNPGMKKVFFNRG